MNSKITWIFGAAMCLVLFSSSSSYSDDPNGKAGASGAPGEQTCAESGCHDSFTLNSGTGSITISAPNLTNWAYTPGNTYTISVTVAQSNINLFGLCFEALKPNGDNAGTVHASTGTQIKNKTIGGFQRHAITHNTNTGATANSHTFTFTWDAPATDIGDITFYVAGLAANGNGNEVGDRVYSTSQVVTSAGSVGLDEITNANDDVLIFPNPSESMLQFSTKNIPSLSNELTIIDSQGRCIKALKKSEWNMAGDNAIIDIQNLSAGNYTLCLLSNGRVIKHSNFQKK
jgi:hypothetical protein